MTKKDLAEKGRRFLATRKQAYLNVFDPKSFFTEMVLRDLATFCRAHSSTVTPNERLSAVLEGRREVWLRIQHYLNLPSDELWSLYGRKDLDL